MRALLQELVKSEVAYVQEIERHLPLILVDGGRFRPTVHRATVQALAHRRLLKAGGRRFERPFWVITPLGRSYAK